LQNFIAQQMLKTKTLFCTLQMSPMESMVHLKVGYKPFEAHRCLFLNQDLQVMFLPHFVRSNPVDNKLIKCDVQKLNMQDLINEAIFNFLDFGF